MPDPAISRAPLTGISGEASDDSLVDYCARPACRNEFRRPSGPGRRREYCSETCRRHVQREYRQTSQRLVHFEGVVEQLRADVAAFGRDPEADDRDHEHAVRDLRQVAEEAIARAGGVVDFLADSDDPLAGELRALHAAVAPLLQSRVDR